MPNEMKGCRTDEKTPCAGPDPAGNCAVVELLSRAYCDEWLAVLQYWTAAQVVKGFVREGVAKELKEHAEEELEHAEKLAQRIQELGGEIPISPDEYGRRCNCQYVAPSDPCSYRILVQSIASERCAIAVYQKILEATAGKDMITYHMALDIMREEVEHEHDFRQFKEDIDAIMKRMESDCKKR